MDPDKGIDPIFFFTSFNIVCLSVFSLFFQFLADDDVATTLFPLGGSIKADIISGHQWRNYAKLFHLLPERVKQMFEQAVPSPPPGGVSGSTTSTSQFVPSKPSAH